MTTIHLLSFDAGVAKYKINDGAERNAVVDGKKVTINGYGTFDLADVANAEFVADAGLTGELAIDVTSVNAKLVKADFSKASGVNYTGTADLTNIIGGAGNDTIDSTAATGAASVNAGAGNDSLKAVSYTHLTLPTSWRV